MSPAVKYTLGRLGLFVVVFGLLTPVPLNFLVKAMIALLASAAFSYFLLAKWRNEMAEQLGTVAERRTAEKERLRAALAGDEAAAAAGDRAAEPAPTADKNDKLEATPTNRAEAAPAGNNEATPGSKS
ncbi:DUF4229 domain-containing protein [Winogradskya humida]|uniref:DUF4229 domain-containing protein n=1 Tax=Winogradskya humida TaxID=113566 RepID=A0ABQ3ZLX7_9ACTN|nr:DUF4229 domain-containing protein [Actinoplanes humidus]GIE19593.1 hypothetical protein Ahu01nite_026950 [Actinoplanes humidus]